MEDFIFKFAGAIDCDDVETLSAETVLTDLDEWSSFTVVSTIVMFDEQYGKTVSPAAIKECKTIGDLYKLV